MAAAPLGKATRVQACEIARQWLVAHEEWKEEDYEVVLSELQTAPPGLLCVECNWRSVAQKEEEQEQRGVGGDVKDRALLLRLSRILEVDLKR